MIPRNKEELIKEYNRLKEDPVYFIREYIKVVHPVRGKVPFDLYEFQESIIDDLQEYRFNIIKKFRQAGITTIACAYSLWCIIFKNNFSILVVSIGDRESQDFLRRVREMYLALPSWLRLKYDTLNKHELILEKTKSSIKAVPSISSAGRGLSMSLLIVDEAAFIDGMSDFWAAIIPTLSCVTKDTLVMTPKGYRRIGSYFEKDKKPGDYFNIVGEKIFGKNGLEHLSHGYVSPPGKTKIIQTSRGLTLEVTHKHPLYKLADNKGVMTPSKNLKIGDYLRIQHSMNLYGDKRLPKDLAYMLGGYIAKGWIAKKDSIFISNTNDDFREVYIRNGYKLVKSNPTKLYLESRKTVKKFKKLGINPEWKCDTKHLPSVIFETTKEDQCSFLRGLFDGCGFCCLSGATSYISTSFKLVREVQLLLLNMGIITKIHTQSCKDSYCLVIPKSQHARFRDLIGFGIGYKRDSLNIKCEKYIQDDRKQKTIPLKYIGKTLQKLVKSTKKSLSKFRKENKIRLDKIFYPDYKKRFITVNLLYNLKDIISVEFPEIFEEYKEFFNEFCGPILWDRIVSIKDSFADTVDFTVPDSHSFLQNGILGSNTGGNAFIISTVNGVGNFYYDKWFGAVEGKNEFHPIEISYKQHPEYTSPEWEKTMRSSMSKKQFAQEFECLGYDSVITVKNTITGDIKSVTIGEIYEDLSSL